jgi:hypothetical protein
MCTFQAGIGIASSDEERGRNIYDIQVARFKLGGTTQKQLTFGSVV